MFIFKRKCTKKGNFKIRNSCFYTLILIADSYVLHNHIINYDSRIWEFLKWQNEASAWRLPSPPRCQHVAGPW